MADQRITELVELPQGGVAFSDVLPIADISASQTKKVQVKSLIQAGFNLVDSSTLDISKINQASATKLGGASIATNTLTYDKIQTVGANKLLGRSATSGNVEEINCTVYIRTLLDDADAATARSTLGLGAVATGNTITTSLLENLSVTTGKIDNLAVTSAKLASGSVDASKILDGAVSSAKIQTSGITSTNIQDNAVTLSKIQTVASDVLLGRSSAGSGNIETISLTAAGREFLDDADPAEQRTTLGLGSLAIQNTVPSGGYAPLSINTADIANNAITGAKIVDSGITAAKIVDGTITTGKLSSDSVTTVKIVNGGVTADKIANGAVSYSKIQATSSSDVLLGRLTASGGTVEEIACTAAARSILDDSSISEIRTTLGLGTLATQNGSFSGTSTGVNTGDQVIVLTGDVTGTGTGSFAATIVNSAITEAKIASAAVSSSKVADNAITAAKLADQSVSIVIADLPSASGDFIGQQWFNTNNSYEYVWDGAQWIRQAALNAITVSGDAIYSFTTVYPDNFSAVVTPSLIVQSANEVLVGPASGSDAAPTFRVLQGADLPAATASAKGAIIPGAGLSMNGNLLNHTNATTSGTYYKVSVDTEGHVTSGATALIEADIPSLDASKITTGTFGSGFISDKAVLGTKLADYSTTKFGESSPPAEFIGQFFFNPLEKDLLLWDGNVWNPVGVSIGEIILAGTYNASGNTVDSVTSDGTAAGLVIGQPLPAASASLNSYYVVVSNGGTGTSPAPTVSLQPPDIILCNGTAWVEIDVSSTFVAQNASNVSFTPSGNVSSSNVQAAIEEVSTECRNANNITSGILDEAYGGTGFSSYTKGDLLAASGTTGFSKLGVGTNGQVLTVDSAQATGIKWATPASGTVTSVSASAPLFVVNGTTTPLITISGATTSSTGVVQLSNSVSTTSSTLAATSTAVKTAYDLASAALPNSGGTITGELIIGNTASLAFEGTTNDSFEITLTAADPTADRTITLPNVNGTVVTTGDSGTVTNAMLAGSIADTKLNTISAAGKVSNSATTATSVNTASTIVARDASGNFSAGTITATIDDGTY